MTFPYIMINTIAHTLLKFIHSPLEVVVVTFL